MRYADWGERSSRWAGIRSEMVDVCGTSVHLLRANASSEAPVGAPTELLVHPMASGAMFWLDVLRPLTACGPVIAPDLPGAVFGHTASPHRYAARAEPSARFRRALTITLGLDRLVVYGWSFGGLVALLFADLKPTLVERLVLTDPTLPGPMSPMERACWHTLGRLALLVGPALVGGLVGVFGSALTDMKRKYYSQRMPSAGRFDVAGGDLSRCSAELTTLVGERLAQDAINRLAVPTLLLWGDQDPLIERTVIDNLITRRPDWDLHIFETVGHLPPWEVPDAYAQAVGRWLAGPTPPSDKAAVNGTEP